MNDRLESTRSAPSYLALTLGLVALPAAVPAQEPLWGESLVAKVDSLAEATVADGLVAGLSIGVMRSGELLLARGYGFADLENPAPAGAQTIYGIGSLTKQFTAAAILQLAEDGEISLDDPITRFLPDYPPQGQRVTIRHLLTHTSGIWSYPEEDASPGTLAFDVSDEDLRSRFENEPFDFEPGSQFGYSNSGYLLLGMIIGEVTGRGYSRYMDERVFVPMGLARTSYCDTRRITPGRARGYWIEDGALVNAAHLSMTHAGAAGALCSTVLDLLSWSAALRGGRVVSPAAYREMTTRAVLDDGTEVGYGFGLRIQNRLAGHPSISHGGGVNGYQSELVYYPEADLDIAVISNTNGLHVHRIADTIAKWVLGIPVPVIADEQRSAEELEAYVGVYEISDQEWSIVRRDSRLYLVIEGREDSRLRSQGGWVFVPKYSDYARLTFVVKDGQAAGFSIFECVPADPDRCRTREGRRVR